MKMKMEDKKDPSMASEAEETAEEVVTASVLETAEVEEEVNLGVGSDDTEAETNATRAALVDFVRNRLGKKLNKGE
jgi:hypothetical protein